MIALSSEEFQEFILKIGGNLNDITFRKINSYLEMYPNKRNIINPAFPYPRQLSFGVLKDQFVVEYIGPEILEDDSFSTTGMYQPKKNIYDFLGMEIGHINTVGFPCYQNIENMSFFIGNAIEELSNYFYDYTQLPSDLMVNGFLDISQATEPIYLSNVNFFWTDLNGFLKIRHIDFMEIIPFINGDLYYHDDAGLANVADVILETEFPKYEVKLHKALNEFIEFIHMEDISEPKITSYLEKNPEILQIAFGAHRLNPQVILEWQYPTDKSDLKPDFLIEGMDGYADILEFKLPNLKSNPVVGTKERSHPSFEIDSAISQIDLYEEWCHQHINRDWLEKEKGIKILNPRRILVIGHSDNFPAIDRQMLRRTRNIQIFTYDEFIELARFQVYRVN